MIVSVWTALAPSCGYLVTRRGFRWLSVSERVISTGSISVAAVVSTRVGAVISTGSISVWVGSIAPWAGS